MGVTSDLIFAGAEFGLRQTRICVTSAGQDTRILASRKDNLLLRSGYFRLGYEEVLMPRKKRVIKKHSLKARRAVS